jgi:lipid-binding SYLF domain-containing protein
MYGPEVTHEEILSGRIPVPESAHRLAEELGRYPSNRDTGNR